MNTGDTEYRAALDFLYSFVDYEKNGHWKYDDAHFELTRVRELLGALGDPHRRGVFVHVAGTNGKGSVCAMIAAVLREAGLVTGLYTSPHLVTFRERIRLDGRAIPREEVITGAERIRPEAGRIPGLTFFDVWTALAFDHFAAGNADVSVIEVGMGGRLDSTNVITPAVSVITSVSMDHRGKLGDTVAEIAAEKAGIIKPGIPVVLAPQHHPEVTGVIAAKARETGSELIVVGSDAGYRQNPDGTLRYRGRNWTLDPVRVPLAGAFQLENAATAIAALEIIVARGLRLTPETVARGIGQTRWPGRLETVAHHPDVIVDGACNTDAMTAVRDHLHSRGNRENTVAVVGMCGDKDMAGTLALLAEAAPRMVFTRADNPRAMDAAALAARAPEGVAAVIEPTVGKAVRAAAGLAGPEGTVIVTGSLYLVGEVLRMYGIGETD